MIRYTWIAPVIVPGRLLQGRTDAVDRFHGRWVANAVHLRSDSNDWSYIFFKKKTLGKWSSRLNVLEQKLEIGMGETMHTMTGVLVHVPLFEFALIYFLQIPPTRVFRQGRARCVWVVSKFVQTANQDCHDIQRGENIEQKHVGFD